LSFNKESFILSTTQANLPKWLSDAQGLSSANWFSAVVPLNDLTLMRIDETEKGYQRPLSDARITDLTEHFDAGEAREIYVSKRADGMMAILDGQHTCQVLRNVGIESWPCRVFIGLTPEEEARRFAEYQNNTRRIPAVVQWNAEVISGKESVVEIDKVLNEFYLRISTIRVRNRDGYRGVGGRATFEKIYALGGSTLLRETLQLVTDAWGQGKETYFGRVLSGLGYLLAYAEGAEFDRNRFIAVLRNTTPKQIVEGIGSTGSGGATRAGALLLLDLYIEGTSEYPKIRRNEKTTPKLPDKAPKEGSTPHEFFTEDTADSGRSTLAPMPKTEPKAEKPKKAKVVADETVADSPADAEVEDYSVDVDAPDADAEDFSGNDFEYPEEAVATTEA
jgi:hypothetical protein